MPLSRQRAVSSDPAVMSRYFDLLEQTIEDNGLGGKPCNIFNMDETGMPLDPKPLKTIHIKGERNPVAPASGLKTQITVVGCVSAGGYCLPPMVIWDGKKIRPELTVGEVPGTIYGLSAKGWMDQELFDACMVPLPFFEVCSTGTPAFTPHGWAFFTLLSRYGKNGCQRASNHVCSAPKYNTHNSTP